MLFEWKIYRYCGTMNIKCLYGSDTFFRSYTKNLGDVAKQNTKLVNNRHPTMYVQPYHLSL